MSKLRNTIKRITQPFLKTGLAYYYRKPRKYKYQEIEVLVHPDVFPPHLTLSTKILLDFIVELELQYKTFLELGCGSGIISLLASKKGATVTSTDINETALEFLEKASFQNDLKINIKKSNLFENIEGESFEFIVINPPYYPKKPKNVKEKAWFCGEDFEYFKNLFQQLPNYISTDNYVYMILSEDCEINTITTIASKNQLILTPVFKTTKMGEKNTIFQITTT
ncbi:MAG: methyltransferase [Flavobacteriaceae bacterium]|nr:methyltransferase [Flavobacteriaceae bacterium]